MLSRMLFLILASISVFCQTKTPDSAGQIRSLRQEIDKAFQRHDAKQLATLVSPDCRFTAPSVHIDGSDALLMQEAVVHRTKPCLPTGRVLVLLSHGLPTILERLACRLGVR
jgi:hypothetical protein